jgi:hypothetical protein
MSYRLQAHFGKVIFTPMAFPGLQANAREIC